MASEPLHIDLCCGLGGWQAPFQDHGWRSVGVDIRDDLEADVIGDVRNLPFKCRPTVLTASPPCTEFSRWDMPWCEEPDPSLDLVRACLRAVDELQPEWWVLENVRGLHRYWRPCRKRVGAFHLWGEFPPFDVEVTWKGKEQLSGTEPEKRAEIPYPLANALRHAVEVWGSVSAE